MSKNKMETYIFSVCKGINKALRLFIDNKISVLKKDTNES